MPCASVQRCQYGTRGLSVGGHGSRPIAMDGIGVVDAKGAWKNAHRGTGVGAEGDQQEAAGEGEVLQEVPEQVAARLSPPSQKVPCLQNCFQSSAVTTQ